MPDRYAASWAELCRRVLDGPATTSATLRRQVAVREGVPEPLRAYVDKLHDGAFAITDADVAALRQAGFDDDAVFELTASAAVGAASLRCARALALLDEGDDA
ncbi:MAG: hypothetical protein U0168_21725 [Nannocystaceae bacterium]